MNNPSKPTLQFFARFSTLFLSLSLSLPNPAGVYAEPSRSTLREESVSQKNPEVLAGLEEALRSGNPDNLLQLASATLGITPPRATTPPSIAAPAAGMEEAELSQAWTSYDTNLYALWTLDPATYDRTDWHKAYNQARSKLQRYYQALRKNREWDAFISAQDAFMGGLADPQSWDLASLEAKYNEARKALGAVPFPYSHPAAAGMEEWIERAVAVVDRYMARSHVAGVFPLLRDEGQPLDVTEWFPDLQADLQDEGIALERVHRIPPAFFQSAALPSELLKIWLDPEAAWAGAVQEQLEAVRDTEGQPLFQVVADIASARFVVAERKVRIDPEKQTLIRVHVQPADPQRVVQLVTKALFAHLENSRLLLKPRVVIYLYQGDPDKDAYLFA